jgi:hypothetical protein
MQGRPLISAGKAIKTIKVKETDEIDDIVKSRLLNYTKNSKQKGREWIGCNQRTF